MRTLSKKNSAFRAANILLKEGNDNFHIQVISQWLLVIIKYKMISRKIFIFQVLFSSYFCLDFSKFVPLKILV